MSLIIVYVVLALGAGFAAGFFFYRLRHSRELGLFEARETALSNRETEFDRLHSRAREVDPEVDSASEAAGDRQVSILRSTIDRLREELEERSMALDFLTEEHRLEQKVLHHEIASLKAGRGRRSDFRYEIEDVHFETSPGGSDAETGIRGNEEPQKEPDGDSDGLTDTGTREDGHREENAEASSNDHVDEPASFEKPSIPRTAVDWAGDIVSYLFDDLIAAFSGEPAAPSEKVPTEKPPYSDAEPGSEEVASTGRYPKFRTLHELQILGGLDHAAPGVNGQNGSESSAELAGLRLLLGLSADEFSTLAEMGYASYEDIAQLSDSEIDLLSDRFGVPAARIISIWISGAQLRLHQDA